MSRATSHPARFASLTDAARSHTDRSEVRCPQCGASSDDGGSCRDRFDELLALEFTDPDYGAVHHLTVPAYMLQHDEYGREAWLLARELLRRFLDGTITPEAARRRPPHGPSLTRGPRSERARRITWSRTIADVRSGDAQTYRDDVRTWATSVVKDSASAL